MNVITFTEAQNNLQKTLDQIVSDASCTTITRDNGDDVVVMSQSHYGGLMETLHLLSSPAQSSGSSKPLD